MECKIKLLTIGHAGVAGHKGGDSTAISLQEQFTRSSLLVDAKDFVANFLLCVLSRSGSYVSRPLVATLHASRPKRGSPF